MKVLFFDWFHWVYSLDSNPIKKLLEERGIECKFIRPWNVDIGTQIIELPYSGSYGNRYRGFLLEKFIDQSAARLSGWYDYDKNVVEKLTNQVGQLIDWAYEVYGSEEPDWIYVEGGLTYFSRVFVEIAREFGIKVIAVENPFIKHKVIIEFLTGYVCNRHSFAKLSKDWLEVRYLSPCQLAEVEMMIKETFDNLRYRTEGVFDFSRLKYDRTIFVPLQLYNDQSVVFDSEMNNKEFIDEVVKITLEHFRDWNVLFKPHPYEERLPHFRNTGNYIESLNLPDNYVLLRDSRQKVNTQSLIRQSDLVFVINSQAGLEACLLGKPVVVFGNAFYAGNGFTLEYNQWVDWNWVKSNLDRINNREKLWLWYYYFYKWLFNREFTNEDEIRIERRLDLCS